LLGHLTRTDIPWAVATSGNRDVAKFNLELLDVEPQRIPVITRNDVKRTKPDPDLHLAAAEPLGVDITYAVIVGPHADPPREAPLVPRDAGFLQLSLVAHRRRFAVTGSADVCGSIPAPRARLMKRDG